MSSEPAPGAAPSSDISEIARSIKDLHDRLGRQSATVQRMVEQSLDAVFTADESLASEVIEADDGVDAEDVLIERSAVKLLSRIASIACTMPEPDLRLILTIVKANNEFERIADLAVYIAERISSFSNDLAPPAKFRVLANSVIGIVNSTSVAFTEMDVDTARVVLASDDATESFKAAIMREAEESLVRGEHEVDYAFALNRVAASLGRIADHCTNIAEQILYARSGMIVRHRADQWSSPETPRASEDEEPTNA